MNEPGHRNTRTFGTRRAVDGSGGPDPWSGLPGGEKGRPIEIPGAEARRPAGPLPWALRTAALVGLGALLATQYLAQRSGSGATAVLVAHGPRGIDPETTGSIGRPTAEAARSTRLDPCATASSARAHP